MSSFLLHGIYCSNLLETTEGVYFYGFGWDLVGWVFSFCRFCLSSPKFEFAYQILKFVIELMFLFGISDSLTFVFLGTLADFALSSNLFLCECLLNSHSSRGLPFTSFQGSSSNSSESLSPFQGSDFEVRVRAPMKVVLMMWVLILVLILLLSVSMLLSKGPLSLIFEGDHS